MLSLLVAFLLSTAAATPSNNGNHFGWRNNDRHLAPSPPSPVVQVVSTPTDGPAYGSGSAGSENPGAHRYAE